MIIRQHSSARMSQIVTHPLRGSIVTIAGQVAEDTSLDVAGQTADILAKIDRLLADAGTNKEAIVSAYIWLGDVATFNEVNAVWDRWVARGHQPARACVGAALARPDFKVEIQVIAYVA